MSEGMSKQEAAAVKATQDTISSLTSSGIMSDVLSGNMAAGNDNFGVTPTKTQTESTKTTGKPSAKDVGNMTIGNDMADETITMGKSADRGGPGDHEVQAIIDEKLEQKKQNKTPTQVQREDKANNGGGSGKKDLQNYSYEEINMIIQELEKLIEDLTNEGEDTNQQFSIFDQRVYTYFDEKNSIQGTLDKLAEAIEKLRLYLDWLRRKNEQVNSAANQAAAVAAGLGASGGGGGAAGLGAAGAGAQAQAPESAPTSEPVTEPETEPVTEPEPEEEEEEEYDEYDDFEEYESPEIEDPGFDNQPYNERDFDIDRGINNDGTRRFSDYDYDDYSGSDGINTNGMRNWDTGGGYNYDDYDRNTGGDYNRFRNNNDPGYDYGDNNSGNTSNWGGGGGSYPGGITGGSGSGAGLSGGTGSLSDGLIDIKGGGSTDGVGETTGGSSVDGKNLATSFGDVLKNGVSRLASGISPTSRTNGQSGINPGALAGIGLAAGGLIAGAGLIAKSQFSTYTFTPEDWEDLDEETQNIILADFRKVGFSEEEINVFVNSTFKIKASELDEHTKKIQKVYEVDENLENELAEMYNFSCFDEDEKIDNYYVFIMLIIDGKDTMDEVNLYNILNVNLEEDDVDFIYSGINMEEYIYDEDEEEEESEEDVEIQQGDSDGEDTEDWLKDIGLDE